MIRKHDCRYFDGSKPCVWNKQRDAECEDCSYYSPKGDKILVIKLDAPGDVVRTLCITPKIRQKHDGCYIVWITKRESRDLVCACPDVDEVREYGVETLSRLHVEEWDCVYSFSNDHASATLAAVAKAQVKHGFVLTRDGITPTNEHAGLWLDMAVFDRVKRENLLSYQEIMYKIGGFRGPIERPKLELGKELRGWAEQLLKKVVRPDRVGILAGINTGAGTRWPKKMPKAEKIAEIAAALTRAHPNMTVLLLGGRRETKKNKRISALVSDPRVIDAGCSHSTMQFAAIVERCDVLLCGDTLALHLATAFNVPTVALFGPTSVAEIYDYGGLVKKLCSQELDCLCCYGDCDKDSDCMQTIPTETIVQAILGKVEHSHKKAPAKD